MELTKRHLSTTSPQQDREFVGKYKIPNEDVQSAGKRIGSGAISRVSEGILHGEIPVAIKEYDVDSDDINQINDFYKEARILLTVQSEHIIKCYGVLVDEENCSYNIVMERAGIHLQTFDGKTKTVRTLRGLLNLLGKDFPHELGLMALNQAGKGVLYLHKGCYQTANKEEGIHHGDIKAANILVINKNSRETIEPIDFKEWNEPKLIQFLKENIMFKLCDFSSTGHYDVIGRSVTTYSKQYHVGTVSFCPPEKWRTENNERQTVPSKKKSDVYSFGMLCYEIFRPDLKDPWEEVIRDIHTPQGKIKLMHQVLEKEERPSVKIEGFYEPANNKDKIMDQLKSMLESKKKREKKEQEFRDSQLKLMEGQAPTIHDKKLFRELIRQCWKQNPEDRPSMYAVLETINALCVPYFKGQLLNDIKDEIERKIFEDLLNCPEAFYFHFIKEVSNWNLERIDEVKQFLDNKSKTLRVNENKNVNANIGLEVPNLMAAIGGIVGFGLFCFPPTMIPGAIVMAACGGAAFGFGGGNLAANAKHRNDKLKAEDGRKNEFKTANVTEDFFSLHSYIVKKAEEHKQKFIEGNDDSKADEALENSFRVIGKFIGKVWTVTHCLSLDAVKLEFDSDKMVITTDINATNESKAVRDIVKSAMTTGVSITVNTTGAVLRIVKGVDFAIDAGNAVTSAARTGFTALTAGAKTMAIFGLAVNVVAAGISVENLVQNIRKKINDSPSALAQLFDASSKSITAFKNIRMVIEEKVTKQTLVREAKEN